MSTSHVQIALQDQVLRVTLCRPEKKNALTNAMYGALADAIERAEQDPDVRVVLIDAEGDAFTAGNDLGDFAAVAAGTMPRSEMRVQQFLGRLSSATKPYVTAVQGLSVGIGVTMLLHCDFVLVSEQARLSTPFVNLALVPEAGSSLLMPARIGHARAFAMFALGDPIDGRTAAAWGIANECVPATELRDRAATVARKLAARPPGALRAMKQLLSQADATAMAMARESEVFGARLQSSEAAEVFRAFAERRAPDFSSFT